MKYFQSLFWEIKKSNALKTFGALLSVLIIFTLFEWKMSSFFNQISVGRLVCWPWVTHCDILSNISYKYLDVAFYMALAFALLGGVCYFLRNMHKVGWFFTLFSFISFQLIYLLDYRLSSQLHYNVTLLGIIFLFVPSKKNNSRHLIIFLLILSGLQDLNAQWLTGEVLENTLPFNIHVPLVFFFTCFSAIIPVFFYSRKNRLLVVMGLIYSLSLMIKHFLAPAEYSWLIVGSYWLFIAYLLVDRFEMENLDTVYTSYILPEPSFAWTPLLLITVIALQTSPLAIKNSTSEKLKFLFSYHTENEPRECELTRLSSFEGLNTLISSTTVSPEEKPSCDPFIMFTENREICRSGDKQNSHIKLKFHMIQPIGPIQNKVVEYNVDSDTFCKDILKFSSLGENTWLNTKVISDLYF